MDRRGFLKRLVGAAVALPFVPRLLEVEPVAEPVKVLVPPPFKAFERKVPSWVRVSYDVPVDDDGLDLDGDPGFAVGDLVLVPRTGEIVRVDAVIFGREIVVGRGHEGTVAQEIYAGDWLKRLGSS